MPLGRGGKTKLVWKVRTTWPVALTVTFLPIWNVRLGPRWMCLRALLGRFISFSTMPQEPVND